MMPLLAEIVPEATRPELFSVLMGLAALLVIADRALGFFERFKLKPPITDYVLREELNRRLDGMKKSAETFRTEILGDVRNLDAKIAANLKTASDQHAEIMQAIGQLQGPRK